MYEMKQCVSLSSCIFVCLLICVLRMIALTHRKTYKNTLFYAISFQCRRKYRKQSEFLHECRLALWATPRFSELSRPRKILYRDLVERVASDPLTGWLGLSATGLRSFWSWAPVTIYLNNLNFSLTCRLIRNAPSLNDVGFNVSWADMSVIGVNLV